MAINVDQVYKTVLLIINKEQRGYLTPNEFNKLATQVQLDILDTYFETINQQLRVPQNESEYGDRYKSVQEKLDMFKTIGPCTYNAATATAPGFFTTPISSGVATGTQNLTATLNTISYPLTTITQAQVEQSTVVVTVNGVNYVSYNITGGSFNLTAGALVVGDAILITIYPEDFYKLGTVIHNSDKEVQVTQRNELAMMNLSTLTKPSVHFPVYLYENKNITIFPQSIISNVEATYVKKPADVMWNFTATSPDFTYVWNPATSVDFELDITEQTNVVLQILLYAGVVIKDPGIVQAAAGEIAQEKQNERN